MTLNIVFCIVYPYSSGAAPYPKRSIFLFCILHIPSYFVTMASPYRLCPIFHLRTLYSPNPILPKLYALHNLYPPSSVEPYTQIILLIYPRLAPPPVCSTHIHTCLTTEASTTPGPSNTNPSHGRRTHLIFISHLAALPYNLSPSP